jgi:hypothetical protein
MWKRVLPVLFAAIASVGLPAQAQTDPNPAWTFSYTGFLDMDSMRFEPGYQLDGFFRGSDADGDGLLELGELSTFYWAYYSYFENPYTGCNGASCRLDDFRYDLRTGQLSFDAQSHYSDEASISTVHTVAGLSITWHGETGYRPPFSTFDSAWQWTDQTRFAISPPPVDEAPALALLPPGLLLLGALARRSTRQRRAGRYS